MIRDINLGLPQKQETNTEQLKRLRLIKEKLNRRYIPEEQQAINVEDIPF